MNRDTLILTCLTAATSALALGMALGGYAGPLEAISFVTGAVAALDNPPPDDGQEKAGGSKAPHRIYNIGNNKSEELTWMIGALEQACGRKAEKILMPMQPGDVRDTYADISAIQRDLGFAAVTSIDEGIPRFVAWFRSYYGL